MDEMTRKDEQLTLCAPGLNLVEIRINERDFPRLQNMPAPVALKELQRLAYVAAAMKGTRMAEDMRDITAAALYTELMSSFPTLTLPEIAYAIRRGVFGEYGEVYGVNAVSLFQMVRGYAASDETRRLYDEVMRERKRRGLPAPASTRLRVLAEQNNKFGNN